ncbi:tetratricopeptide repeat protein [Arcticibacterium luteifluviistationis]|nr:tetratricopeptide repeat protein [Arcticibacterium luteifluviistationis]
MKFRIWLLLLLLNHGLLFAQNQSKIDSLKSAFRSQLPSLEKAQLSLDIVKFYSRNNSDSTAKYLEVSKNAVTKYGTKSMQARNRLNFANYLQNRGDFDQSIKVNQEAIDLYERIKNDQGLGSAYNTLGLTFKKIGRDKKGLKSVLDKALQYSLLSKEYYQKANDTNGLLSIYSNLGIIYRSLHRFPEAEKSYLDGLAIAEKAGIDSYVVGVLYANLSQIYLDNYQQYDKAIGYLGKALAIYQKHEIYNSQEHVFRNLAINYTKKGDFVKANFYAEKAVEIAEKGKDPHRMVNAYTALFEAQHQAGNNKEAYDNLYFVRNLEDSIMSIEKTAIIAEADAKFESLKNEAKIQVLSKTNELNKWRIVVLLLFLMALGILYYSIHQKRGRDKLVFENEKKIEKEKLRFSEKELDIKKKELTAKVLQLAHKNEFLNSLKGEMEHLKNNVDDSVNKTSNRVSRMINRDIEGDTQWNQFSQEFSGIHQDFLTALTTKFGSFTKSEIRLISLLKMNMNSKEITSILGISDDGIRKARYRLRKKMNLEESELQSFLLGFS